MEFYIVIVMLNSKYGKWWFNVCLLSVCMEEIVKLRSFEKMFFIFLGLFDRWIWGVYIGFLK